MLKVESNLGFGCSGLMARLSLKESVALLETAYDQGITYFDVARSYGYGTAEVALGEFAAGKRDKITIATKFGILPPRKTTRLSTAKKLAKLLVKVYPGLRTKLRHRAASFVLEGQFGLLDTKQSILTSLESLRTDHIDVLMFHECGPETLQDQELAEFLSGLLEAGTIGRLGLGAHWPTIDWALKNPVEHISIFQFVNCPLTPRESPHLTGKTVVTHSALRENFLTFRERLLSDNTLRTKWSDALGTDLSSRDELAALILAWALRRFPQGRVLFSTSRIEGIQSNVRRSLELANQGAGEEFQRLISQLMLQGDVVSARQ